MALEGAWRIAAEGHGVTVFNWGESSGDRPRACVACEATGVPWGPRGRDPAPRPQGRARHDSDERGWYRRVYGGGTLSGSERRTEYGIKQVGDRYFPVIVDKEAGGHYEINNPLTGGSLSYKSAEQAEAYIERARAQERDQTA